MNITSDNNKNLVFHSGLFAWMRYLFVGGTLKIQGEHGQTLYLKLDSIISNTIQSTNISGLKLDKSKMIQNRLVEYLNPVKNVTIKLEDVKQKVAALKTESIVRKLEKEKYTINANKIKKAEKNFLKHLEELKNSHLEILPYQPDNIEERLKPGDVFCCKWDEDKFNIAAFGQSLQFYDSKKQVEREGNRIVHLAIYIGNGILVEAVPSGDQNEIRRIHLSDPRFSIKPDSPYRYIVSRCKDEKIAQEAGKVAREFANPGIDRDWFERSIQILGKKLDIDNNKITNVYAYVRSGFSIFASDRFGNSAKKNYVNQYNEYHKQEVRKQAFYCSQLVLKCLQIGEAKKLFNGGDGEQNPEILAQVQLDIDANWTTPQDFRNFILRRPEIFEDVFMLEKPSKLKTGASAG